MYQSSLGIRPALWLFFVRKGSLSLKCFWGSIQTQYRWHIPNAKKSKAAYCCLWLSCFCIEFQFCINMTSMILKKWLVGMWWNTCALYARIEFKNIRKIFNTCMRIYNTWVERSGMRSVWPWKSWASMYKEAMSLKMKLNIFPKNPTLEDSGSYSASKNSDRKLMLYVEKCILLFKQNHPPWS